MEAQRRTVVQAVDAADLITTVVEPSLHATFSCRLLMATLKSSYFCIKLMATLGLNFLVIVEKTNCTCNALYLVDSMWSPCQSTSHPLFEQSGPHLIKP